MKKEIFLCKLACYFLANTNIHSAAVLMMLPSGVHFYYLPEMFTENSLCSPLVLDIRMGRNILLGNTSETSHIQEYGYIVMF